MASDTTQKKENKDLIRKEEPTKAPTPDKLDRSARTPEEHKPYPLTEEEATPKAGVHERDHSVSEEITTPPSKSVHKDYNKLVSGADEKDTT